ncbi:MAG: autophagy- protein 2 [Candelina mexicana]|nr:MAG: autophagy- protein 2 [Candelina mexicana]
MSYFLPAFFQKRLLRYALSRLELLDTDALDLDKLDIAWGKRSTVELRDLSLCRKKIASLLSLSQVLDLTEAKIVLLRVIIPADIYSSPIVLEVEGIVVHARILTETDVTGPQGSTAKPSLRQRQAGGHESSARASQGTEPLAQNRRRPEIGGGSPDGRVDAILPTTVDLAQSFLEAETLPGTAELKAAIESPATVSNDEAEGHLDIGTGTGLSLPRFLAGFLKDIRDRLEVRVKDVCINLAVDVGSDGLSNSEPLVKADQFTVQLQVKGMRIEGATTGIPKELTRTKGDLDRHDPSPAGHGLGSAEGTRHITLQNLHGTIVSDATLFASLSQLSAVSSPAITQSDSPKNFKGTERTTSSSSTSISPVLSAESNPHGHAMVSSPLSQGDPLQDSRLSATAREQPGLTGTADDLVVHESTPEHPHDSAARYRYSSCYDSTSSDQSSNISYYDSVFEETPNELLHNDIETPPTKTELQQTNISEPKIMHTAVESHQPLPISSKSDTESQEIAFWSGSKEHPIALPLRSSTLNSYVPSQSKTTDNLAHSIQASSHTIDNSEQGTTASFVEDLSESRIFSHDEAESMYMSAISQVTAKERQSMAASGKWDPPQLEKADREDHPMDHGLDASPAGQHQAQSPKSASIIFQGNRLEGDMAPATSLDRKGNKDTVSDVTNLSPDQLRDNETTRPPWSNGGRSSNSSGNTSLLRKQVLYIDQVDLFLPTEMERTRSSSEYAVPNSDYVAEKGRRTSESKSVYPDVPGAFSVYAEHSRLWMETASATEMPEPQPNEGNYHDTASSSTITEEPTKSHSHGSCHLIFGFMHMDVDVSIGRSLAITTQKLKAALDNRIGNDRKERLKQASSSTFSCNIGFRSVTIQLLERLIGIECNGKPDDGNPSADRPSRPSYEVDTLLRASIGGLDVQCSLSDSRSSTQISLKKFLLSHSDEDIISFDASQKLRDSTRDMASPADKDVHISIIRTKSTQKLSVQTVPVQISLNLERIDETLNRFGGLSGILELGSSIASDATIVGANPATISEYKASRTVHFETRVNRRVPLAEADVSSTKIDIRLGGAQVDLVGRDCSLILRSSAWKFVSRGEAIGLQVDRIKLSGPHHRQSSHKESLTAAFKNIRVEFLPSPKEVDLGRLLSLLTPSKNKYDDEDDILLDTLLRQRRKGSLIRVTVEKIQGDISCVSDIAHISNLAKEAARFSKVAKYLPEDDRPGILTLTSVRDLCLDLSFDARIGRIQIALHNLEFANVALPLLVAIGVEGIQIHCNQDEEFVGKAYPQESPTDESHAPMIMARVIGDELEPTIKVKLWNVRVEYRVPMMMAVAAMAGEDVVGDLVSEMVGSVATIAANQPRNLPASNASSRSSSGVGHIPTTKFPKVAIVLLDCIVGLNPRDMHHKGLVVLTDTLFSGELRPTGDLEAVLKVQKTSILIIDDVRYTIPSEAADTSIGRQPRAVRHDLISRLCQIGFVCVGYISAAKAAVTVNDCNNAALKSVDVDLRDDLLVLETCADSTQTLLGIVSGLKPPSTPSKVTRYRTEIIPLQDMLASLSGDAFAQTGPVGEAELEAPLGLDEGDMVDDEVPQNLEFVNSFYTTEPQASSEEIADSVLEDDLDHLVSVPATREIGDKVLLESFREQYEVAPGGEPLDFREDHFGTNSVVPETTSRRRSTDQGESPKHIGLARTSKFRVRLRDVHIIWNQYDGYDWQRTRDTISKAVKTVETKAAKGRARDDQSAHSDVEENQESVIGDFLFNSIYIGIPAKRDPRELSDVVNRNIDDLVSETESYTNSNVSNSPSRQSHGSRDKGKRLRLGRSKHHKIAFELKGVSLDLLIFAPDAEEVQSSLDIRVRDIEIFDHVPTSTWKKFATYMHDAGERESGSNMIHLNVLTVKPVPELEASEFIIKATILPLRLHVDQDALDFITRFFEFKDDSMTAQTSPTDTTFIQRIEVDSLRLRLDYKPKTVDYAGIRSGHTTEFMNFFILDQADMVLRHVIIYGVAGLDKLSKTLNDVWMPDIRRNQLPGVLAGLAPFRSLVGVGGGVRDLVAVPMREYRKDGRVVRSIQKGAVAFARTTTNELVKLGAKLAIGTQTVLQGAEQLFVEPEQRDLAGREDASLGEDERKTISLYADQPVGVVQGLRGAYAGLERDLATVKDAIIAIPGEVLESGSAKGAARAVLRRAPTVIFRPALGASRAISQTLMGATNSLDPQNRRRVEEVRFSLFKSSAQANRYVKKYKKH